MKLKKRIAVKIILQAKMKINSTVCLFFYTKHSLDMVQRIVHPKTADETDVPVHL